MAAGISHFPTVLATILSYVPGSTKVTAWLMQRGMLRGNRVRQEHKPSLSSQHLFWAARHPILFACEVALACLGAAIYAWPCFVNLLTENIGKLPWLTNLLVVASDWQEGNVDVGAFIGVPWSVQATLVALVYPLVLSFVAVFLQRRAKADVVLRIYMFSSGILPAGASSLALLAVLSVEYFATPVLKSSWASAYIPFVVGTGLWFLVNIALTALFLARTLKYLQADEQLAYVWKAAIGVIYYEEMRESLRQNIVNERLILPRRTGSDQAARSPMVRPVAGGADGVSSVTRNVTDGSVLAEVYLPFLEIVARSWLRRAADHEGVRSTLNFGVRFGRTEGVQRLAVVSAGPELRWWERLLVRRAFIHRARPSKLVTLTTAGLLSEMASAVVVLADQGHIEEASDAVRDLSSLVTELLKSGRFIGPDGEDNAALLSEARYVWWGHPFLWGWTRTFSDISARAVELAPRSTELFRALAYVSPRLLAGATGVNLKVADACMGVFIHLDFQLSEWWRRNVVGKDDTPSALPQLSSVNKALYDELLAVMVGAWSDVVRSSELPKGASADEVWNAGVANGRLLRLHLDTVAARLCKAVERGDLAASRRYGDLFLKWGEFNLGPRLTGIMEFHPDFYGVGLNLLNLGWDDARFELATANLPADIQTGKHAVTLTVRRYFEAMRLQLILMLLESAPPSEEPWSACTHLALDMAIALIKGDALHRGGTVGVDAIHKLDDVLERVVHAAFIDRETTGSLEAFASSQHRSRNAPDVNGWGFGGSLPRFEVSANTVGWVRLLGVLSEGSRVDAPSSVPQASNLLARLWRKLDTLREAADFFDGLSKQLTHGHLSAAPSQFAVIQRLREKVGKAPLDEEQVIAASAACESLAATARWHRRWTIECTEITEAAKQAFLRGVVESTLHPSTTGSRHSPVRFAEVRSPAKKYRFELQRESLIDGVERAESYGRDFGYEVRQHLEAQAMRDLLEHLRVPPVDEPAWSEDYMDPRPAGVFIDRVGMAVQRLRTSGIAPAVVVGSGRGSLSLRPETFHTFGGREPVQTQHAVVRTEVDGGESLTIDGAPILQRRTPSNGCYVVPLSAVEALVFAPLTIDNAMPNSEWRIRDSDRTLIQVCLFLHAEYAMEGS
ncbi:hypothetical protein PEC18_36950 [Paucibacter sp. O1-1]|nr:hypothetical protein [Paucibacter sp. O1-1]MDA3831243.1 hypothetical protein [Paucibacter sp. O1-1]